MSKFFRGERVILTHEVVFLDSFDYNNKRFARVAFEDKPWSYLVLESSLSKHNYCQEAAFAKCNNGEGCDTCQYNEEKE